MYKLIVLYPEPQDKKAFVDYYEAHHLPLAAKLPGLLSWAYGVDLVAIEGAAPYFALFEAEFESAGSMQAALSSPEGVAVQSDVPNYATGGAVVMHYEVR